MTHPEFSHIIRLSELGSAPVTGQLHAEADQLQALAQRFDLPAIKNLRADYRLKAGESRIAFSGTMTSDLEQQCVVSAEAFPVQVEEQFDIAFVPKSDDLEETDEVELQTEDCDLIDFEDGRIDLGEALAQTLYLALDPYPRGPNADAVAKAKGLQSEEQAGPFGALAALKDKLG